MEIVTLDITSIVPDEDQVRKEFDDDSINELAASIKTVGLINPITVKQVEEGKYTIIAGERRYRAFQLLQKSKIPCIIKKLDGSKLLMTQLIENIQRQDLNPIEVAKSLNILKDEYNINIRDLAKKVGLSKSECHRKLQLLGLPEEYQSRVINGEAPNTVLQDYKEDNNVVTSDPIVNTNTNTNTTNEIKITITPATKMPVPLIRYMGGKNSLATRITDYLPPHALYCEPFAGSAAVFFRKGVPNDCLMNNYREVLNDKHEIIINLFRCLQNKATYKELQRMCYYTCFSRLEQLKSSAIIKNYLAGNKVNELELAWATYVSYNFSFGGILNSSFAIAKEANNFGSIIYRKSLTLNKFRKRLERTCLECDDALEVIKRYDSPHTCFYIDPPYVGTEQDGYADTYNQEDFNNLIELLKTIEGSFVLSSYPNLNIPDEWDLYSWEVKSTLEYQGKANSTKERLTRQECIWVVDRSKSASNSGRELFKFITK